MKNKHDKEKDLGRIYVYTILWILFAWWLAWSVAYFLNTKGL